MDKISVQSQWIDQISFLEISREITNPAPLVFFVHGFGSDKRQGIPLGYELAQRGIVYVSIDTILRGERKNQEFDPAAGPDFQPVYKEENGLDGFITMLKMIKQTGLDLNVLIDHFSADPRINPERIGLAGYSMGGWATFYITSVNPRIKAAAAIAGTPCFEERWNDVILESSTYPKWSDNIKKNQNETSQRTSYIREMDPITHLIEDPLKPLLIICGDLDTQAPKKYCLDLLGKINQTHPQQADRLRLSVYDGIGHQLTLTMAEETADWFVKNLG